tara:strand:- start:64 stop:351 length:288 start_codon:yes stop_codon:yes gene_type:complete
MQNVVIMRERSEDWEDLRYSLSSGPGSVEVKDLGAEDLHEAQARAEGILGCELQEKRARLEYLGRDLSHLAKEYEVSPGLFRQVFHFFKKTTRRG